MLADGFSRSEPLDVLLGITSEQIRPFASSLYRAAIKVGLEFQSFVLGSIECVNADYDLAARSVGKLLCLSVTLLPVMLSSRTKSWSRGRRLEDKKVSLGLSLGLETKSFRTLETFASITIDQSILHF